MREILPQEYNRYFEDRILSITKIFEMRALFNKLVSMRNSAFYSRSRRGRDFFRRNIVNIPREKITSTTMRLGKRVVLALIQFVTTCYLPDRLYFQFEFMMSPTLDKMSLRQ